MYLLEWLGKEYHSQYGECAGLTLDRLVSLGYVKIHGPGEHQSGFIAQGDTIEYCAVSLTDKGRSALQSERGR